MSLIPYAPAESREIVLYVNGVLEAFFQISRLELILVADVTAPQ